MSRNACIPLFVILLSVWVFCSCFDGVDIDCGPDEEELEEDDDTGYNGCDDYFFNFSNCFTLTEQMVKCDIEGSDIGYLSLSGADEDCQANLNCDFFLCMDMQWEDNCGNWKDAIESCQNQNGGSDSCDDYLVNYYFGCDDLVGTLLSCFLDPSECGYSSFDDLEDDCSSGVNCDFFICMDEWEHLDCDGQQSQVRYCDPYQSACDEDFYAFPNCYQLGMQVEDCGMDETAFGFSSIENMISDCYNGFQCNFFTCADDQHVTGSMGTNCNKWEDNLYYYCN